LAGRNFLDLLILFPPCLPVRSCRRSLALSGMAQHAPPVV